MLIQDRWLLPFAIQIYLFLISTEMNIRLFPDGTAYVSNQTVVPTRYANNYYLLPLSVE